MGRSVDYWALGHIHKRNVISTSPYIVYPGNIQGRSFKGTGEKGAYLVRVSNGRVSGFEFIATQTYVWNDMTVDITDRTLSSITEELSASLNRRSIARIRFTGSGSLDTMLRSKGEDVRKTIANSTGAIVSDIVVDTSPELDIASMSEGKDMRSAVIRSAEALSKMSKKEIIDAICSNKLLSRNRSYFESLDDVQIKALVDTAMKNALIGLEVRR
jgi:DNA repair exonuclease SbcCD nuclease subunit